MCTDVYLQICTHTHTDGHLHFFREYVYHLEYRHLEICAKKRSGGTWISLIRGSRSEHLITLEDLGA